MTDTHQMNVALGATITESFTKTFAKAGKVSDGLARKVKRLDTALGGIDKSEAKSAKTTSRRVRRTKAVATATDKATQSGKRYALAIRKGTQAEEKHELALRNTLAIKRRGITMNERIMRSERRMNKEREKADRDRARMEKRKRRNLGEAGLKASVTGAKMTAGGSAGVYGALRFTAPARDFNKSLSLLQARTGMSKDERKELADLAKKVGRENPLTASQSANAMAELAASGWSPAAIKKGFEDAVNLSLATNTDIVTSSDLATNIMTPFGMNETQIGDFSDTIAAATNTTASDFSQIAQGLTFTAGTASGNNISLEDNVALLGAIGEVGLKSGRGGRALAGIFDALFVKKSEKLAELGVDVEGRTDVANIMREVDAAITSQGKEGQRSEYLKEIFGTIGGRAAGAMMAKGGKGLDAYDRVKAKFAEKEGLTRQMAATSSDNLASDLVGLGSAIEGVRIAIGDSMKDELRAVAGFLTGISRGIASWMEEHPFIAKVLGLGTVAVAGLVAVMGGLLTTFGLGALAINQVTIAMARMNKTAFGARMRGRFGRGRGRGGGGMRNVTPGRAGRMGGAAMVLGDVLGVPGSEFIDIDGPDDNRRRKRGKGRGRMGRMGRIGGGMLRGGGRMAVGAARVAAPLYVGYAALTLIDGMAKLGSEEGREMLRSQTEAMSKLDAGGRVMKGLSDPGGTIVGFGQALNDLDNSLRDAADSARRLKKAEERYKKKSEERRRSWTEAAKERGAYRFRTGSKTDAEGNKVATYSEVDYDALNARTDEVINELLREGLAFSGNYRTLRRSLAKDMLEGGDGSSVLAKHRKKDRKIKDGEKYIEELNREKAHARKFDADMRGAKLGGGLFNLETIGENRRNSHKRAAFDLDAGRREMEAALGLKAGSTGVQVVELTNSPNIQITIPAGNQSPEAIAKAVAAKLEEMNESQAEDWQAHLTDTAEDY